MKKILVAGIVAGVVLLVFGYGVLFLSIKLFPNLVEEYYNPIFWPGDDRAVLYYLHPFILAMALSWFWERFKSMFSGPGILRGLELGLVYGVVASLPSMWMTFSAMSVSLVMVLSWLAYGVLQASVAGIIFARMNP